MSISGRIVPALAAVLALTPVVAVHAQDVDVVARVPFAFNVGDASLPQAAYRISRLNNHPEMLLVRSEWKGVFIRAEQVSLPRPAGTPSLVFHRYGDQYFLREVHLDGRARLDLPETKAEREAADTRPRQAALLMQTVVIFAERP
jgi:hypothetical protein